MSERIIDLIDVSLLKQRPLRPAVVTRMILSLLRHYFSSPKYLITNRFRNKHNPSPEPSQHDNILITSSLTWQPEMTDQRPAIVTRRLRWVYRRMGIGDGAMINIKDSEFAWSWRGNHAVYAISREGGELDELTAELSNCFGRFGPVIRELLGFQRFQLVAIDQIDAYVANKDYFQAPIVLQYEWIDKWKIDPGMEEVRNAILSELSAQEASRSPN